MFIFTILLLTAHDATFSRDYEKSEEILKNMKCTNVHTTYLRMINLCALGDESCIKHAEIILEDWDINNLRYVGLAATIKEEALTWEKNDLAKIAREMNKVKDRLYVGKGGKKTQEIQKKILEGLARKIKKLENEQEKQGKQEKINKNTIPPNETPKGEESGSGQVDIKQVKEIADIWGKLPEKERAKALVELKRNLPKQDRDVIERYFKELSKRSK